MNRTPLLTTLTFGILGALLLGACGFATAARPGPTPNPTALWRNVAQCLRDHGYADFPDPTVDSQGRPQLPPGVKPPTTVPSACQSALDTATRASETSGGSHQPTHDVAKLRLFAQCMRDNGLDNWPDPDTQGRFHLPEDLRGKSGPRWAAIRAAWTGPCAQYKIDSLDVSPS